MPVCVSPQDREASKSNAVCWPFIAPCCGFIPSDAPSPLRTPEDSQTYEHISRSIFPVSARPVSVCQLPTFSDVTPVQARKGAGQIRNLFQFAMLFEKSKEKSKIRTWYHKSFLSTSRLSELGGRERGTLEGITRRGCRMWWGSGQTLMSPLYLSPHPCRQVLSVYQTLPMETAH